ncbi:DNA-processing protein DprA [Actinomadura syzygii]|uniref:Smf/DprA SLOG domain-containing protein n=1 Tax=Actinomadura syzygii TaxID=1427538 RepID=A0A5D0UKS0_9ACTN|nr:DNA-processing protein DprA [Actinomadura syzygii]TYC18410.1 hypothetical protein FXF65_01200 [Actinomadura syzygii]
MPQAVTITGTRSTGHRVLREYRAVFDEYVRPFARPGVRFHLGGASGIDSLALRWLADETEAELVVIAPGRLTEQPKDAQDAVAGVRAGGRLAELVELGGSLNTEGYFTRNRWMVDRSGFVIGFPLKGTTSSGTWYTIDYAANQHKPRLIMPV